MPSPDTAEADEPVGGPVRPAAKPGAELGAGVVNVAFAGTGVFVAAAVAGAAVPRALGSVTAVVSGLLFAAGCGAFLWAYAIAVNRSRTDAIGIGALFFLTGETAPNVVRFRLLLAFTVQVVTALAAASVRPYTAVAFVILGPVFGLGLTGLWGARYGTFPARGDRRAADGGA